MSRNVAVRHRHPTRSSDHRNRSMCDSSIWDRLVSLAHVFEILLLESYAEIKKHKLSVDPSDGEQERLLPNPIPRFRNSAVGGSEGTDKLNL